MGLTPVILLSNSSDPDKQRVTDPRLEIENSSYRRWFLVDYETKGKAHCKGNYRLSPRVDQLHENATLKPPRRGGLLQIAISLWWGEAGKTWGLGRRGPRADWFNLVGSELAFSPNGRAALSSLSGLITYHGSLQLSYKWYACVLA